MPNQFNSHNNSYLIAGFFCSANRGLDTETASVCLWREAAIQAVKIDDLVLITHLKTKESERGWCLQSTAFTKVEKREVTHKGVTVIRVLPGTTSSSNSNSEEDLQLLLEDGR
ncbi:uncharacterized protein V6R79_018030 [Siganus canaliculatus]